MKTTNLSENIKDILFQENLIKTIRLFFEKEEYHEIITPVLSTAVPNEPNIVPFVTSWQKNHNLLGEELSKDNTKAVNELFLSTSPEKYLKKVLVDGLEKVYAVGHSFRNLENSGDLHSPEFLMLEWYSVNNSWIDVQKQVIELISFISNVILKKNKIIYCGSEIDLAKSTKFSLNELFQEKFGKDFNQLSQFDEIEKLAQSLGYSTINANWEQMFNQIFLNHIEPALPQHLVFLTDFPAQISPLCKRQIDRPYLAERFEVYLAGIEIANGNTEETDYLRVRNAFEKRQTENNSTHQQKILDEDFIQSLKQLNEKQIRLAGIGLGIDRLSMILQNKTKIATHL